MLRRKIRNAFACSFLDTSHRIIATKVITTGTINQAPIYPREIVKSALLYDSSSVILAHNHPGGSLSPSPEDIAVTKLIGDALATLKIDIVDHIIVGDDKFTSFCEKGLPLISNDNSDFCAKEMTKEPKLKPLTMSERIVATKESALKRSSGQKLNAPEKDRKQSKERVER